MRADERVAAMYEVYVIVKTQKNEFGAFMRIRVEAESKAEAVKKAEELLSDKYGHDIYSVWELDNLDL